MSEYTQRVLVIVLVSLLLAFLFFTVGVSYGIGRAEKETDTAEIIEECRKPKLFFISQELLNDGNGQSVFSLHYALDGVPYTAYLPSWGQVVDFIEYLEGL